MIDIGDFNEKVKSARAAVGLDEEENTDTTAYRRKFEYLVPEGYASDLWPADFVFPPRIGDGVESTEGNRLRIGEVIHRANGITIKLVKETGGISPVGGGGAQETDW